MNNLLARLKAADTEEARQERKKWLEEHELRKRIVSQALLAMPVGAFTRYRWGLGECPHFYGVVLERRADRLILRDITRVFDKAWGEDDPRGEIINMMFHDMPQPSKIERIA